MPPQNRSRIVRRVIDALIVVVILGIAVRYLTPATTPPERHYELAVQPVETGITVDALYQEAINLRDDEQYEGALALLDFAIAEADTPDAWMLGERVWLLNTLERYEEAITEHEALIEIFPLTEWRANNYCYSHSRLNLFAAGWEACNTALAVDGDNYFAETHLCYIGSYSGDHELAVEYCDAWIAEEPDDPYPYNNRGRAHLLLGAYDQALADINRSIALENDHPHMTHTNRALVYLALGDTGAAYDDLQVALDADPTYPDVYLGLAQYHELLHDRGWDDDGILENYCSYLDLSWQTPDETILERVDALGGC